MIFAWDDANTDHIAAHDVSKEEAECVVEGAKRPYPRKASADKFLVKGRTWTGRWLQVIYLRRLIEEVDASRLSALEQAELIEIGWAAYVIHARDLRPGERRI